MKQFKLTFVLTVLMSMLGLQAFADWDTSTKVENNGIYYYLDNDNLQAQVTSMPSGKYTGAIMIPTTFTYNKTNYSVTSIDSFAFEGCSGLTSITIPNSVTSIGSYAFYGCSGLTSITIPNSVTSIGGWAFYNTAWYNNQLDGLVYAGKVAYKYKGTMPANTVISILEGTLGIGESAFQDCTGLTSVTIPNSVTSIGDYAFNNCSGLTSVTIPNSITSIGDRAFSDCPSLTSMLVESGNTKYDSRNDCNAIIETASNTLIAGCKATIIPNSVTNIGNRAFERCSALTSIDIPYGVTSIGNHAFDDCSDLTSVTIPNSVTSIGDRAFSDCGLTSVTIPNSVTSIGNCAFEDCPNLASIVVESGNPNYDSRNDCNAIIETASNTLIAGCKNTIIPNNVASIGSYAFYGCTGLTSITIPNSVTSIGDEAFDGCSGLTSVTALNPTPVAITDYVFTNRTNATLYVPKGSKSAYQAADYWKQFKEIVEIGTPTNIVFADANVKAICVAHWDTNSDGELSYDEAAAVTTISDYFANNTSITSFDELSYFTGLTSIGNNAFSGCSGLTSVTIPNSVTIIGEKAFRKCFGLTSVIIPNSVMSIGERAFEHCTGLTSIDIPNGVTSIDKHAFDDCSNLTSVTIPNSVTSIGDRAFSDCGLTFVTIPNSVTSIGNCAFEDCPNLASIVVESGNPNYDSRNDCNAIIETASNTLIAGCKNTIIPNSVTSIGNDAFYGCSGLTSITIPNSVTSIGHSAFQCSNLTSVTVSNSTPVAITQNVFTNRTNATLYVPKGSKEAYKAADYWKEFKEIVEIASIADEMTPIEEETTIDMSGLGEEDLTNNVVDDVYYNVGGEGYDGEDQSVVIGQATDMQQIADATPGSSDISNLFTGLILKVGAGYGTIIVNALTSGNAQLAIQIGNSTPTIVQKSEKGDVQIAYNVTEDTYVYIYSVNSANSAKSFAYRAPATTDMVKIYNVEVLPGVSTGIDGINYELLTNDKWYTLDGVQVERPTKKGIFIKNGKKVVVK